MRALMGLLLVAFVVQASIAAVRDSVTIDEFVGLPVGLYTLRTGDVSTPSMNPPFFRTLAALPLLRGPEFTPDPDSPHWEMGTRFMIENAHGYHSLYVPARCVVILFATLLGALVFFWARELYGVSSALVALGLFAFSPSLLAHGHLVTLDVAGALCFTLTLYLTWRLIEHPAALRALALGVSLGLSPLLKLSGVMLAPIVLLLIGVRAVREPSRPGAAVWVGFVGLIAIAALMVVNLAYSLDGTLAPLATIGLDPNGTLIALSRMLPDLRLPLPAPFLKSLDLILTGDQP
ncbi:MAG: ArnT family glycosyltransferase, partial [Candidatus Binatia bacterium]